jgi:nicotinamide mononucleotide (NMN) deamidase PncC
MATTTTMTTTVASRGDDDDVNETEGSRMAVSTSGIAGPDRLGAVGVRCRAHHQ